ncbi:MAG: methylaspartate mutase accessory protein GlmL [Eubacteriales bacterium]|nr:methylaspartate mutase accessory protein GlmL [Clostridiales bacterium]MDY5836271.1 methylaspartate mutase accessory protein GlmL [Eubacteriales bacterium]
MKALLLSDFGSTFTKLCAVDPEHAEILGTAAAFTTIQTDIFEGFQQALGKLESQIGPIEIITHKACSSAAGGLRMLVSGLMPELTAEAAKMAALGAGAKVIKVFDHELTDEDLDLISELKPDIFLLTGGTDGGNQACILENAQALADIRFNQPIIVAGNRSANRKIRKIFTEAGLDFHIVANVMPRLGELNIAEAQEAIRQVFLAKIVEAKGLSRIEGMIHNILLPTPAAMLAAMKVLAQGTEEEAGLGDLIAVDPGGATTDVYSMAYGLPEDMTTVMKGLPEPYAKRTVEGDIGMRYSLHGILEAKGLNLVAERAQLAPDKVQALCDDLAQHTDRVPATEELRQLDDALVGTAIDVAVGRHCGSIEEVYTPMGRAFAQTGKDLRSVDILVLTGGAVIHSHELKKLASYAAWDPANPTSLRPKDFKVLLDQKYILSAMGVLCQDDPSLALRIMKKELVEQ